MPRRDDIETDLAAVAAAVDRVPTGTARVRELVETAAREQADRGHDGIAGRYRAAERILETAAASIAAARSLLARAAERVARTAGTPTNRPSWSRSVPTPPTGPEPRPDKVAAVRRMGWPRNASGRVRARGAFNLSDGSQPLPDERRALRRDVFPSGDLKAEYRNRDVTISWHIEGGVARWLRHHPEVKRTESYLNVSPCGGGTNPADPAR